MIDKIFEWTISISVGALGICAIIACIGMLIGLFRDLFD